MGDGEKAPLRLQFNPKVRLEFHGSTITSDAGLLAFREFDDALGLTEIAEDYLQESRTGRNILHHLVPLLRQSIYSRLAGYDDTNDAVRLSQDPAMRVIVGWQGSERKGASTSEMGRFETEFLTQEDNLKGLARINTQWVERAMAHTLHRRVILDMDSSESPVHGQQEGAAYNGHFECVCYHPLFLFNQFGDCEAAKLRSGNVHSADDWQEVLDPVVERYLTAAVRLLFRADAAFAKPEIYDYLEARNIGYAIRLRSNQVLQREIAHRLIRPTEWLSPKPIVSYHDFVYQAQSWNVARRVVSKNLFTISSGLAPRRQARPFAGWYRAFFRSSSRVGGTFPARRKTAPPPIASAVLRRCASHCVSPPPPTLPAGSAPQRQRAPQCNPRPPARSAPS